MIHSIEELAKAGLRYPNDFATSDERAYTTHAAVFGTYRDNDCLGESNWYVFCRELGLNPEPGLATDVSGLDGSYIMRSGHWAVGWVETIMVPVYQPREASSENVYEEPVYTDAFLKAWELHQAMADYPALDDSDLSERETNDLIASLNYAFSIPEERCEEAYAWLRDEGFDATRSEDLCGADRDLIIDWYEQSDLDCPTWLTKENA